MESRDIPTWRSLILKSLKETGSYVLDVESTNACWAVKGMELDGLCTVERDIAHGKKWSHKYKEYYEVPIFNWLIKPLP